MNMRHMVGCGFVVAMLCVVGRSDADVYDGPRGADGWLEPQMTITVDHMTFKGGEKFHVGVIGDDDGADIDCELIDRRGKVVAFDYTKGVNGCELVGYLRIPTYMTLKMTNFGSGPTIYHVLAR